MREPITSTLSVDRPTHQSLALLAGRRPSSQGLPRLYAAGFLIASRLLATGGSAAGPERLESAWSLATLGNWSQAAQEAAASVQLLREPRSPLLPEALLLLGLSELQLGSPQVAFDHLSEGMVNCSPCPTRTHLVFALSAALRDLRRYNEAESQLRQALAESEAKGSRDDQELAYKLLGYLAAFRGNHAAALPLLQSALKVGTTSNSPEERAGLLHVIGVLLTEARDGRGALTSLRAAESLYENLEDHAQLRRVHTNIAKAMVTLGDYGAAAALFERVEAACRQSGDRPELARALTGLGEELERRGLDAKAQQIYEEALELERVVGTPAGEANLFDRLAQMALTRGQFGRAFDLYEQAVGASKRSDNRGAEATTSLSSANLYIQIGAPDEGALRFRRADKISDGGTIASPLVQALYATLSLFSQHRLDEALEQSGRALQIARDLRSMPTERDLLTIRALLELTLDRRTESLSDITSAITMSVALGDRREEARGRFLLGYGLLLEKKYREARSSLEASLKLRTDDLAAESRAMTLWAVGAASEKLGDTAAAIAAYQEAVAIFDSSFPGVKADALLAGLVERAHGSYSRLARLLALQGDADKAFQLAERNRARIFLRRLGNPPLDFRQMADPKLPQEEGELRSRIATLSLALDDAQRHPIADSGIAAYTHLAHELDEARRAYGSLLIRIQQASPEYASLLQSSAITLGEVQRLLDTKTTLVEYLVLADETLAWVIERSSIHLVRIELTAADAAMQVENFRELISRHESSSLQATLLYQTLVAPLAPYIHHENLYLVPDGVLQALPFAALRPSISDEPLFVRYSVGILPSAGVLPYVLRQRTAGSRVLAMGDPDGSLPAARAEVRATAALYGVRPLLGAEATTEAVRKDSQTIGVLHIAAHASSDPERPLFSRILLADGDLTVADVLTLDLRAARLIVLSGCETGLGGDSGSGDRGGLDRAFLLAGASAILATLWPVDDLASRALMEAFHRQLRAGASETQALRRAQGEIRARPEWRDPFYWAAFSLTGSSLSGGQAADE